MLISPITATCLVQFIHFGLIDLVLGIYREVINFVLICIILQPNLSYDWR